MARIYQPADMSELYGSNEPKRSGRFQSMAPEEQAAVLAERKKRAAAIEAEDAAARAALVKKRRAEAQQAQAAGTATPAQRRQLTASKTALPSTGGASGSWGEPMTPEEVKTLEATTGDGAEVADSSFADADPAGGAAAGLTSDVDRVMREIGALRSEIASATGARKKALIDQTETLERQAGEMAARQQEMADRADRRVRGMELMTQRQKEAESQATAEIRNAERMVTSHEIDPNRAFKTTGARVGSAIAIAMSALGQGMSGRAGPNTAYKIINDAINRDIDLQKEELRTRKDVMRNKNNLYANMMAKFGDERSAELATAKAGMTAATQSLQALKATHKSQNAQLIIDEQIAKLDAEGQKKEAELLKLRGNLAISKMNIQGRAGARGGRGRRGGPNDPATMAAKVLKKLPILEQRFNEIGPEGVAAFFPELIQGIFPGVRSYEASRNRVAKEITRAFDGGRPTEKDFAVIAMGMPKSYESRKTGGTLFRDLTTDLTLMLEDEGTLQADKSPLYASFIARGGKLSEEALAQGREWAAQAEKENWEFFKEGQ